MLVASLKAADEIRFARNIHRRLPAIGSASAIIRNGAAKQAQSKSMPMLAGAAFEKDMGHYDSIVNNASQQFLTAGALALSTGLTKPSDMQRERLKELGIVSNTLLEMMESKAAREAEKRLAARKAAFAAAEGNAVDEPGMIVR